MPRSDSIEFTQTPTGRPCTAEAARAQWEQACRQRWRALALVIKAKLEAVDSGIVTLVEEFAAHVVLPGGQSVGDLVLPAIAQAYTEDSPAPMLAAFGVVRELPRGSGLPTREDAERPRPQTSS